MTPDDFKRERQRLGLSLNSVAELFRRGKHGNRNVHRWERGDTPLPGWAALIMEIISSGKIPDLSAFKRKGKE